MINYELDEALKTALKDWLKRYRRLLMQKLIFIIFMVNIVMFVFLQPSQILTYDLLELCFLIICLVAFIYTVIFTLMKYRDSLKIKADIIGFAKVMKKKRHTQHSVSQGKNARGYYIDVIKENEVIEAKCDVENYRVINTDDDVLLFCIGNKRIYAIKA